MRGWNLRLVATYMAVGAVAALTAVAFDAITDALAKRAKES